MTTRIFVNLPVKQLDRSIAFFARLGFSFDPRFTDDSATCLVVADNIFVMLLTEPRFQSFTPKAICDATHSTEVLLCLSAENRERVDEIVRQAVAAGGSTYSEPQDHDFMYGHGFQDLDGHIWEIVFMDPDAREHAAGP
ncbi:VOC family protein [Accumulibacter sp.]|uniref:VOC family protein n=1 Tax=Accumulibacter sp. TaxID=2053492 RepID=UPI001A46F5E5|nr:VOC family protein [Accumulibacter sp.]MBL8400337.1 VOC family protein [Accumulibacter sp.]